jgi:hypothetical protein
MVVTIFHNKVTFISKGKEKIKKQKKMVIGSIILTCSKIIALMLWHGKDI